MQAGILLSPMFRNIQLIPRNDLGQLQRLEGILSKKNEKQTNE
jgi:hypothetical protein